MHHLFDFIVVLLRIWQGMRESLEDFMKHLNCNGWGTRFTGYINKERIEFLDLSIFIDDSAFRGKPSLGRWMQTDF